MPRKKRMTVSGALFELCWLRFTTEGWRVEKSLVTNASPESARRSLAESYPDRQVIRMFPHLRGVDETNLEKTLLHELLHVGLDVYDEEMEPAIAWLEKALWRQLNQEQKGRLNQLLAAAGKEGG